MSDNQLPKDVFPNSRCRLPLVEPERLPKEAQELFHIHADPTGWSHAGLQGPGGIRLHSPQLATLWHPVGRYLRDGTGLSQRVREIAILITAREHDSSFEWHQHEKVARVAGVPEVTIEVIRHRKPVAELDDTDSVVIRLGRAVFGDHAVEPALFQEAMDLFGTQRLIDLVAIMGTYSATAAMLTLVDAQLPPDEEALLPLSSAP